MDKDYIERHYHQAVLDFKLAANEDEQWDARKTMARLEALAIELFGEKYSQELREKELDGLAGAPERKTPRRYRQGPDGRVQRSWNGKLPEEFNEQDTLAFVADTDLKLNGILSKETLAAIDQAGYAYQDGAVQSKTTQEARPVNSRTTGPAEKKDKLQETLERLEAGVLELFESDRYKNYLSVMSKFHQYSINNSVLIAMQRPDATRVSGYNNWKDKFHRQVRRGEKGIRIIQPAPYQAKRMVEKADPHTGETITGANGQPVMEETNVTINAYKVGYVFDISQTDGPDLPSLGSPELTGDVEAYPLFLQAVEQASPVPVNFEQIQGSSKGYYHQEEKRIAVKEGMGELQNIKTLIHEIAHAKLRGFMGDNIKNQHYKNMGIRLQMDTLTFEAESTAYTVCRHFGLDTSDYSFAYLTAWSSGKELPELKASLEVIRSASSGLIKDIEKNYAELAKDKGHTQAQEAAETGMDIEERQEADKASGMPKLEKPEAEENTAGPPAPEQPQASDTPWKPFEPESIYEVRQNPYSDSPGNSHILQEYVTQESGMAKLGDTLYIGTTEECQKLLGRLEAGELTQSSIKELNQGEFQKKEPGTAKSPDRKTPEEHPEGRPSVIGRLQSAKGAASGQGRDTRRQYKNRFNDFQQNTYDFDALEKKLADRTRNELKKHAKQHETVL